MANQDLHKDRVVVIKAVVIIAIGILLLKAMQLQLLDNTYRDRARTTAIDKVVEYPSRGLIFDRNGKLLVNNNAIYDLLCTYNRVSPELDTAYFCELLQIDRAYFNAAINKNWNSARYSKRVPFTFLEKISAKTYARFQESMHEFSGFEIRLRNVRGYPYRNSAHALGYLSEVSQNQINNSGGIYRTGDFIGSIGLERTYESELKGSKGIRYLLKDNLGRPVGSYRDGLQDTMAVSGKDLKTTLDVDLQILAEKLMANKSGSIVAIEPKTGEILSLMSAPYYDPNLLTIHRGRGQEFVRLQNDTINKPFLDRAVMAKYPPGSIFKTVVSLIGMQEGVVTANTPVKCNGAYYYKGNTYGCHQHPNPYKLSIALEHSCNSYYFVTLQNIVDKFGFYDPHQGLRMFNKYLDQFGIGRKLGADIPNEGKGNVPTPEYYDRLYPKAEGSWKSPTIMSIGIGQGEIEMTTLQMANLAAIMANRGWYITPHLAKAFSEKNTSIAEKFRLKQRVSIEEEYFDPIIEGMERSVRTGTGDIAYVPELKICGKTGTSQNPHGKDHSVFFAFAPKENPEIAIAVYVEHGVWGATYAAPIASLMIEQYLTDSIRDSRVPLLQRLSNESLLALAAEN